jgi:peroxiredoxin
MKRSFLIALVMIVSLTSKAQLTVGTIAPEITLPDAKDSVVNLSSFKGKVVLIDFWASWCMPCRASIPGVVRLYNKYKDKGFVVLGVSIDRRKSDWLGAVKKDKITYQQVNDITGWNSKVAEAYNVNEIPATFLLDKNGKIVAVDAEGKALENKVKALLQ